jgi:hypothetical protein
MATYPFAHACGPDPDKTIDRYWKYKNDDPSTAYYATIVSNEIFSEIQDRINKRGKDIYHVRPEAIIVQDLGHEVIRQLAQMLNEHVKDIEQYERENSGDIRNYFDSEEEDQDQN